MSKRPLYDVDVIIATILPNMPLICENNELDDDQLKHFTRAEAEQLNLRGMPVVFNHASDGLETDPHAATSVPLRIDRFVIGRVGDHVITNGGRDLIGIMAIRRPSKVDTDDGGEPCYTHINAARSGRAAIASGGYRGVSLSHIYNGAFLGSKKNITLNDAKKTAYEVSVVDRGYREGSLILEYFPSYQYLEYLTDPNPFDGEMDRGERREIFDRLVHRRSPFLLEGVTTPAVGVDINQQPRHYIDVMHDRSISRLKRLLGEYNFTHVKSLDDIDRLTQRPWRRTLKRHADIYRELSGGGRKRFVRASEAAFDEEEEEMSDATVATPQAAAAPLAAAVPATPQAQAAAPPTPAAPSPTQTNLAATMAAASSAQSATELRSVLEQVQQMQSKMTEADLNDLNTTRQIMSAERTLNEKLVAQLELERKETQAERSRWAEYAAQRERDDKAAKERAAEEQKRMREELRTKTLFLHDGTKQMVGELAHTRAMIDKHITDNPELAYELAKSNNEVACKAAELLTARITDAERVKALLGRYQKANYGGLMAVENRFVAPPASAASTAPAVMRASVTAAAATPTFVMPPPTPAAQQVCGPLPPALSGSLFNYQSVKPSAANSPDWALAPRADMNGAKRDGNNAPPQYGAPEMKAFKASYEMQSAASSSSKRGGAPGTEEAPAEAPQQQQQQQKITSLPAALIRALQGAERVLSPSMAEDKEEGTSAHAGALAVRAGAQATTAWASDAAQRTFAARDGDVFQLPTYAECAHGGLVQKKVMQASATGGMVETLLWTWAYESARPFAMAEYAPGVLLEIEARHPLSKPFDISKARAIHAELEDKCNRSGAAQSHNTVTLS